MTSPKEVYVCGVCEEVHDDYYSAQECCPPEVWTMYQCDRCGETHDDEEDADNCCQTEEDDGPIEKDPRNYPETWLTKSTALYVAEFNKLNHYKE